MKWIYDIWLVLFFLNAILLIFKFFNRNEYKILIGIWAKIFVLHFNIIVLIAFFSSLIEGKLKSQSFIYPIAILIFSLYITYTAFMFRYQYDGKVFKWFNGLYLGCLNIKNISKFIFYSKDNIIHKIGFIYGDNEKKFINLNNS